MSAAESDRRRLFEQEALPHLDVLFTAALYLTRDEHEANDLCQETMLRAYRYFDRYTPGTNCRAWLFTILYNLLRRMRSRPQLDQLAVTAEEFDRMVDRESMSSNASIDPETALLRHSVNRSVQTALRDLPEDFKAALLLVDLQDLTYQDAARVLEVPIGTVRSRVSRGRALMRRALESLAGVRRFARAN